MEGKEKIRPQERLGFLGGDDVELGMNKSGDEQA
jgi:hypothetical protein